MTNKITLSIELDLRSIDFVTIDWENGEASIGILDSDSIDTKDLEAVYKIVEAKRFTVKGKHAIAAMAEMESLEVDLKGRRYCECL